MVYQPAADRIQKVTNLRPPLIYLPNWSRKILVMTFAAALTAKPPAIQHSSKKLIGIQKEIFFRFLEKDLAWHVDSGCAIFA
jgi:hypothetical protein